VVLLASDLIAIAACMPIRLVSLLVLALALWVANKNVLIVLFALCVAKNVVFLLWLLHSRLQKHCFQLVVAL
jgi:hypothetical protein